jgi:small subunit ribosomal protein S21
MIEIKVKKKEPVERALRRLKRRMEKEGVLDKVRSKRFYEKPSAKRRRLRKESKFKQMLAEKYNN